MSDGVFYAGETVVWTVDLTDNEGRIQLTQPTIGVTVEVRNAAESATLLAEATMVLEALETSTPTAAAASDLEDTTKAWNEDEYAGAIVQITAGLGAGQSRRIKRNTDTVLVLEKPWATVPDATSTYKIHRARYEYAWASPTSPATQTVVAVIRAKDDAYKSAEKVELELKGAAV